MVPQRRVPSRRKTQQAFWAERAAGGKAYRQESLGLPEPHKPQVLGLPEPSGEFEESWEGKPGRPVSAHHKRMTPLPVPVHTPVHSVPVNGTSHPVSQPEYWVPLDVSLSTVPTPPPTTGSYCSYWTPSLGPAPSPPMTSGPPNRCPKANPRPLPVYFHRAAKVLF